jgi:uncharacterized membrane protein
MLRRFRNYFFSGLLVVVPIGVCLWILWGLFSIFDSWFRDLARYFGLYEYLKISNFWLPEYGVGFVLTICFITFTGFMTQLYIGRKALDIIDNVFHQIPFVSKVYKGLKQVSESLMGRQSRIFDKVVMIEYPRKGVYSLAFAISEDKGLIKSAIDKDVVYVFLATTPNPTSGFFLMVPKDEVIELNIDVEDGMKMIISSGMVAPASLNPATLSKPTT